MADKHEEILSKKGDSTAADTKANQALSMLAMDLQKSGSSQATKTFEGFLPNVLLDQIAKLNPNNVSLVNTKFDTAELALKTQQAQELAQRRGIKNGAVFYDKTTGEIHVAANSGNSERQVYSAENGYSLPGKLVRKESDTKESGDDAVDKSYTQTGNTRDFMKLFGRNSWDGQGADYIASTHYAQDYNNAFFNGQQIVFGDGDHDIFDSFVDPTVSTHEWWHAITDRTSHLEYQGQSGALNESLSDCFAMAMWQQSNGIKASADRNAWKLGPIFRKDLEGCESIRNLLYPGTAFNNPKVGKDSQPADMDGYEQTDSDNGGVHKFSGIPNRAFAEACVEIGGMAADKPAKVLWEASQNAQSNDDFATFAQRTVDAAKKLYPNDTSVAAAFRHGWEKVKVLKKSADVVSQAPQMVEAAARV